jgi:hypothetical protein
MGKDLAQATDARAAQALNVMRTAVVSSVLAAGGVMVSMNGAVVGPYAVVGSYAPAVGDTVSVIRQDATWLVLGPSGMPTVAGGQQVVPLVAGWTATPNSAGLISLGGRPAVLWVAVFVPGTKVDGTLIGTIPAGLRPKNGFDIGVVLNATVAGGQTPHLQLASASTGSVFCWGCSASTGGSVNAIWPLDV